MLCLSCCLQHKHLIWAPVLDPAAQYLIKLPANDPGKAEGDGPSISIPVGN